MGLDNPLHIAFLVVILLLIFGARRLPEIGRSLGSGMREFKSSITGEAQHGQPTLTAGQPQQPQQAPVPAQPVQAAQPVASAQPVATAQPVAAAAPQPVGAAQPAQAAAPSDEHPAAG
jgi:sec-independent protein translocase protein TatA